MVEDVPQGTTKTGYCGKCGEWTVSARVVAEVHADTGFGGTVLRCPGCDAKAAARAARPTRRPRPLAWGRAAG